MNYQELKAKPVKQNGESANHDFHLRLSKTEKERLIMLTKSANYATMSQFLKDQLFRPDLHFKLDMILKFLKNSESEILEEKDIRREILGEDRNGKNKTCLQRR